VTIRSTRLLSIAIAIAVIVTGAAAVVVRAQLPAIGAGALLFPARRVSALPAPAGCHERAFDGVDAHLAGWVCTSDAGASKPTIVYLHGIGDNRDSSVGVIERLQRRGFNVITYDSRGHGRSAGDRCTYGFLEKQDVRRVLDQAVVNRAIVIGHSLGAAVALQAAAIDARIEAVVAASTFADLRSIATERAPFMFSPDLIEAAFARAERDASFVVGEVSPLRAAASITVPAFIIHGALDTGTRPAHSERVYDALRGPKRLHLVPNAGHNDALRGDVWSLIENWLDELI
jgi:pimeloyl-ACP methyl ester carboxylesterase